MKVRIFLTRFAAVGIFIVTVAIGVACSGDNERPQGTSPAGASTGRSDNPKSSGGQDQTQFSAVIDQVDMAFVPDATPRDT